MAPSNPSHIQPQKIKDIDFRAPKRKKRRILRCAQEDQQLDKSKEKKEKNVKQRLVSKPTQNELQELLSKLNQSENKLGILRVVLGFANNFRPKSLDLSEQMLTHFYDTVPTTLPRDKFLELSHETYAKLKEAAKIEKETHDQHKMVPLVYRSNNCISHEICFQGKSRNSS